jgi:tetratricopeptide (TPR) repeat protein/tRNA A-37 threonylcarbamoyl transferase component Bud32
MADRARADQLGSTITSSVSPSDAPARDYLASGTVIANRYEIVRLIDHGGMGAVYEANDRSLHQRIALKTIRSERAFEPRAIDRFKREALLARRVTHRNVCRVFDVGHHEREMFLTMELLDGETLSARIRRDGKLTPAQALPIVEQMVAALDAAHAAGVVHRDFKCSNVMLVEDRVVVTDFGLAHDVMASGHESSTDGFIGSPAYVAPEQVNGRRVSSAADIYSLGVVMFEMVTGKLPWVGATPMATAVMRLHESAPEPRTHVPDLPAAWEQTILCCLEREPDARFATAGEVLASLESGRIAKRGRRRTRSLAAVAALVVAVAGGGAAWYALRGTPPASAPAAGASMTPQAAIHYTQGLVALEHFQPATARRELTAALAVEPDQPLLYAALAKALHGLEADEQERVAARKAFELSRNLGQEDRLSIEAAYRESTRDWQGAIKLRSALATFFPDNLEYGLALVEAQRRAAQTDDALATIAKLRRLPSPKGDDPRIDIAEGQVRSLSNPVLARTLLHTAIALAAARGAVGVQANGEVALCNLEATSMHVAIALPACNAALSLYELEGNVAGEAHTAMTLGGLYITSRQPDESQRFSQRALDLYREAGSRTGELNVQVQRAIAYKRAGDVALAEKLLREGIDGFRAAGETHLLIKAMSDLASIMTETNRQAESIPIYRDVIKVAHDNGLGTIEANTMSNFSITLTTRGELEEARVFAEQAVAKWKQLGENNDAVFGMDSMGQIALRQGRLADARAIEEEALAGREKLGWVGGPSRQNLASIDLTEHNFARAVELSRKAVAEFHSSNEPVGELYAHDILVRALVEEGHLDEAVAAANRMRELAANTGTNRLSLAGALSFVQAAQGDAAGAIAMLREALAADRKANDVDNELDHLEVLAELSVKYSSNAAARDAVAELRRVAGAHGYTQVVHDADGFARKLK